MTELCIFDMDGTLLYTLDSIARPTNMALAHFGLPAQPLEAFKLFIGDGLKTEVERALIAAGDEGASHLEEAFPLCQQYFYEDPMYKVEPYPGMVDTLHALKEKGVKLAILSNKPHAGANEIANEIFGPETFDYVQGQTDRLPIKPDPAGVYEILDTLHIAAGDCLYIGDTNTDMRTGKNAGLKTVGVLWGYRPRAELEESGARIIIDHPEQLLTCL